MIISIESAQNQYRATIFALKETENNVKEFTESRKSSRYTTQKKNSYIEMLDNNDLYKKTLIANQHNINKSSEANTKYI